MSVTIENKTKDRVLLRFNSGLTRHLAPLEILEGIEPVEVKGNRRLLRLEERHVIHVMKGAGKQQGMLSGDMSASQAIKHIENIPLSALDAFISSGEKRTTVLRAVEEKRNAAASS